MSYGDHEPLLMMNGADVEGSSILVPLALAQPPNDRYDQSQTWAAGANRHTGNNAQSVDKAILNERQHLNYVSSSISE